MKCEACDIVNNTNTKKSLASLSKLYFGIEKYWQTLRKASPNLTGYLKNQVIPEGFNVTIPNYHL